MTADEAPDLHIVASSSDPMSVRGTGWKMIKEMQVHDGNLEVILSAHSTELKLTFSQAKTEELYRILKKEFEK